MAPNARSSTLETKHPVLSGEYAVYTPPMNEMIDTIGDWIDQRLTGGYIYGPSRFGKSRGVKWHVRSVLEDRFHPKLPLVIWNRPSGRRQEGEFWNLLLTASKFHFVSTLKRKKKEKGVARDLFKQQLITLARSARQNYALLIIDEAQDISLDELKWLMGLQNELDFEGFRFSVISIGSHQLTYQPNYLARTGNTHIAARFFAKDARYFGIRSEAELAYVLNGYDVDSDWPRGTNTSYLKYFAPIEFDKGRRLAHHAGDLWLAFSELLPPEFKAENRKLVQEVPMLHIALTVEKALRELASGKAWDSVTEYPSWLSAIAKTGFSEHMHRITMRE